MTLALTGGARVAAPRASKNPFAPAPMLPTLPQSVSGAFKVPDSVLSLFNTQTAAKPSTGGPGATPAQVGTTVGSVDYGAQIGNDPTLLSQLSGLDATQTANTASLTAQRQRALAQYGQVPTDLASPITGLAPNDIDQTTRDLANQATSAGVSTTAQLQKAYTQANDVNTSNLAARGLLHSGALGQHLNENLTGYNQAGYQAKQNLLDYLSGLWSGYQSQQQALTGQRADFTNQALQRLIAQITAGAAPGNKSLTGAANVSGQPIKIDETNNQVPVSSLPDFTNPDLTGNETPTELQQTVSAPDPYTGVFPATNALPVAITGSANKTGLSGNKKQGIFSTH